MEFAGFFAHGVGNSWNEWGVDYEQPSWYVFLGVENDEQYEKE